MTAAQKWRGIRMTPRILRQLDALRSEKSLPVAEQAVAYHRCPTPCALLHRSLDLTLATQDIASRVLGFKTLQPVSLKARFALQIRVPVDQNPFQDTFPEEITQK